MKVAVRVALLVAGVAMVIFGWHKAHGYTIDLASPTGTSAVNGFEMMVVIGALVALLAFAPSSQTLGRWMSLKRHRHARPAHFRRRRRI